MSASYGSALEECAAASLQDLGVTIMDKYDPALIFMLSSKL